MTFVNEDGAKAREGSVWALTEAGRDFVERFSKQVMEELTLAVLIEDDMTRCPRFWVPSLGRGIYLTTPHTTEPDGVEENVSVVCLSHDEYNERDAWKQFEE